MSAEVYIQKMKEIIDDLDETSMAEIKKAARAMANSIKAGS